VGEGFSWAETCSQSGKGRLIVVAEERRKRVVTITMCELRLAGAKAQLQEG
jgi:hypothetical protein